MLTAVGFSTRALVQCARREGLAVRSFDCCGDRDTREIACSTEVIDLNDPSWIKTLEPSARVILAGGCEDIGESLELLSRVDPTIIPEQYLQIRDWRNWRQWALGSGLKFPSTYTVDEWLCSNVSATAESAKNALHQTQRWLWKKQRSAGGLGVSFIDPKELLEPSSLRADHSPELGVLQEYVLGKSIGISFLSSNHGTVIVGMAESMPLQKHIWSDFIYRGSIGPVLIPDWLVSPINSFARTVVRTTGWTGLWQADFLLTGSDLYLIEINPRWTASMELIVNGYDLPLVTWHANCRQLGESDWKRLQAKVEGTHRESTLKFRKEVLYAKEDSIVSIEEGEKWWGRRWIARDCVGDGLWYADIPQVHSALTKGAPVCSRIERIYS